jgi:hypothetical protein
MRGADGVRDKLAALLRSEVPRKIPLLRAAWVRDSVTLPDLDEVVSGEAPDNALSSIGDTWVLVINPRLLSTRRTDIIDGLPEYMTRYACRIYIWGKGDTWEDAIAARDNLAVACRLSLLQYPNLDNMSNSDTGYRLHENTYVEEFGEPVRLNAAKGRRVWAAGVLAVDLDCQETLEDGSTRTPIGVGEQITVTADAAGPTEPFPETGEP